MNIVMFSINPLFPDFVMGGAPKHLKNIAIHLGELGHDVVILCTQVPNSRVEFDWHERVRVKPILRFKQPFPQPYEIPAYEMANILQIVGDHLRHADRFYMHDGEFLFPYAYYNVPTVISLRDNVYPETLLGGFLSQGDKLILISEYSRRYFQHTVGRFFPDFSERVEVIHNGIDWGKFKPVQPGRILDILAIQPGQRPILLHPHRPEESKGIRQTIMLVDALVHQHGVTDILALAPKWLDVQLTAELREFYDSIESMIETRGLRNNFLFHEWIPQDLMPEYYSLGSVTVSLGYFSESFGNAVYESLGCGTPSIAARVSTHRELMPDELLDKVDFGDIDAAALKAARIIREGRRTSPAAMAYLHQDYAIDRQMARYAGVILSARKTNPPTYAHPLSDENTHYHLAPWCYVSRQGIYHDFKAAYLADKVLALTLDLHPGGFSKTDALTTGLDSDTFIRYCAEGYLVPV